MEAIEKKLGQLEKRLKKVEDFINHHLLKQKKITKEGLAVSSQYFQLNSTVQIERISLDYKSIINRTSSSDIVILKRSRGV